MEAQVEKKNFLELILMWVKWFFIAEAINL